MSSYYAGLVVGCLYARTIIARVGHIRAFAAFAAVVSATAVIYPLWFSALSWGVLRAISGFAMAGLFATIESWLGDRSSKEARGQILSLYMVVAYLASGIGQLLVNGWEVTGLELFCLGAVLLSLSLVPVVLTHEHGPDIGHVKPLRFRELYAVSPLGVVGSFGSGLMSGAFYGMGAIFGQAIGLSVFYVSLLMGATVFGGLLLQWPIGRLSDKLDRRSVLLGVLIATALVCIAEYALSFTAMPTGSLLALTALFGGFVSTVYPISVAQAFDHVDKDRMIAASSGMLLAWALGSTAGPFLASVLMARAGVWTLFLYLAVVAVLLAGFARYRMAKRAAPKPEEPSPFRPRGAEHTVLHGKMDPRVQPAGTPSGPMNAPAGLVASEPAE